jgi:MFS family permease
MVFSEWLRAAVFLAGTLLYFTDFLAIWHMYVIAVFMGIAEPLFRPSSMAYVAQMLPKDRLVKGDAFLEGTNQMMMLIVPALGGPLLQFHWCRFNFGTIGSNVNSCCFFYFPAPKTMKSEEKKESWFSPFKEGLGFYKGNPVLLGVGLLRAIGYHSGNFIIIPSFGLCRRGTSNIVPLLRFTVSQ